MHTYIATKKKLVKNGVLFVLAFTSGFACTNHSLEIPESKKNYVWKNSIINFINFA